MKSTVSFNSSGTLEVALHAENEAEMRILLCVKGRAFVVTEVWHEGHETHGRVRKATLTFVGERDHDTR